MSFNSAPTRKGNADSFLKGTDPRRAPKMKRPVCFGTGRLVTTPTAQEVLRASGELDLSYFLRHARGDFGEVLGDERDENHRAARTGRGSILSMHRTRLGDALWLVTNEDRSRTFCFVPEEVGVTIFCEREEPDGFALAA